MKPVLPPAGLAARPTRRGDAGAIILFGTIAALYFAREILVPFAFALILTFLLTPVVGLLEKLRAGRIVSVLTTVAITIALVSGIGWIIANQLVDVANQLPQYRQNIRAKIEAFHVPSTGQVGKAAASVQEVVRELAGPSAASPAPLATPPQARSRKQPNAPPAPQSPVPVRSFAIWARPPLRSSDGREWWSSLRSSCCSREKTCGTAFWGWSAWVN